MTDVKRELRQIRTVIVVGFTGLSLMLMATFAPDGPYLPGQVFALLALLVAFLDPTKYVEVERGLPADGGARE